MTERETQKQHTEDLLTDAMIFLEDLKQMKGRALSQINRAGHLGLYGISAMEGRNLLPHIDTMISGQQDVIDRLKFALEAQDATIRREQAPAEEDEQPKFKHVNGCKQCTFLGVWRPDRQDDVWQDCYDLYLCTRDEPAVVMARFGDGEFEYAVERFDWDCRHPAIQRAQEIVRERYNS